MECNEVAHYHIDLGACNFVTGDELAERQRNDLAVRYILAVQPLYDRIRRSIGHIGGILVFVQASNQRDFLDRSALAVTIEQWNEVNAHLKSIHVPGKLAQHFADLERSHQIVGEILHDLNAACIYSSWKKHFDLGVQKIKLAYSHLQKASRADIGMSMVDHNHSCCNCLEIRDGSSIYV